MSDPPKIAFCIMSYHDVEQRAVWEAFFNTADPAKYSVYVHRADREQESWIQTAYCIPTRATGWGKYSLVEVELDLYSEALKDPANTVFILLSGDTIPLYTFDTFYASAIQLNGVIAYSTHATQPNTIRPLQFREKRLVWRKASQWKLLHRKLIRQILDERKFLDLKCKVLKIPDEHAIPMLIDGLGVMNKIQTTYNIIYVDWSLESSQCTLNHHSQPVTFHEGELTEHLFAEARASGALLLRKICPLVTVPSSVLRSA